MLCSILMYKTEATFFVEHAGNEKKEANLYSAQRCDLPVSSPLDSLLS